MCNPVDILKSLKKVEGDIENLSKRLVGENAELKEYIKGLESEVANLTGDLSDFREENNSNIDEIINYLFSIKSSVLPELLDELKDSVGVSTGTIEDSVHYIGNSLDGSITKLNDSITEELSNNEKNSSSNSAKALVLLQKILDALNKK